MKRESMILYIMRNRVALDKLDRAMKIVEGDDIKTFLENRIKDIVGYKEIDYYEEEEEEEEEEVDEEPWPPVQRPQPSGRTWGRRDGSDRGSSSSHPSRVSKKSSDSKNPKDSVKKDGWNWGEKWDWMYVDGKHVWSKFEWSSSAWNGKPGWKPSEPEIPEIPKLNREILGDAFAEVASRWS